MKNRRREWWIEFDLQYGNEVRSITFYWTAFPNLMSKRWRRLSDPRLKEYFAALKKIAIERDRTVQVKRLR